MKAGARNFLFVNVPPLDRSPGGKFFLCKKSEADALMSLTTPPYTVALEVTRGLKETCETWNDHLSSYSNTFAAETSQATILLFSAHAVLTEVLDDFVEFNFNESDVEEAGGAIWLDELHLTSAVHFLMAERLHRALESHPALNMFLQ